MTDWVKVFVFILYEAVDGILQPSRTGDVERDEHLHVLKVVHQYHFLPVYHVVVQEATHHIPVLPLYRVGGVASVLLKQIPYRSLVHVVESVDVHADAVSHGEPHAVAVFRLHLHPEAAGVGCRISESFVLVFHVRCFGKRAAHFLCFVVSLCLLLFFSSLGILILRSIVCHESFFAVDSNLKVYHP